MVQQRMLRITRSKEINQITVIWDTSEINGDNLCNVRREASRHFRKKERKYIKDKINDLAINRKNKNISDLYRGIHELKRGYQLRSNLVKNQNDDLFEDSNNILNMWKSYFSQLLIIHNASDIRHIEIHTAEPIEPGPNHIEVNIAIAKWESINLQTVIKFWHN
jgi:hypothetical protein